MMTDEDFARIAREQPPENVEAPDFWQRAAEYSDRQVDASCWLHLRTCNRTLDTLEKFLGDGTPEEAWQSLVDLRQEVRTMRDKLKGLLDKQGLLDQALAEASREPVAQSS